MLIIQTQLQNNQDTKDQPLKLILHPDSKNGNDQKITLNLNHIFK